MSEIVRRQDVASAIEQVIVSGDLSRLNAEQRVTYVRQVCESLGLNAATQPFQYIVLNGKLTLYATRSASEQLRKIHGVTIFPLERTLMQDAGLYQVVARGRDNTGREDESSGVVNISGLKGENLANAMLKCETKAKRRLTLSICGLGFLDETEVADIPGARAAEPLAAPQALKALQSHAQSAIMESPSTSAATANAADQAPGRGGSAASAGAPSLPAGEAKTAPQGQDEHTYLVIQEVEYATSRGANPQEFMRITSSTGEKFCCWDSNLFARLEECVNMEIKAVVQYPPPSLVERGAKPKILQVVGAREAAQKEESNESIPF